MNEKAEFWIRIYLITFLTLLIILPKFSILEFMGGREFSLVLILVGYIILSQYSDRLQRNILKNLHKSTHLIDEKIDELETNIITKIEDKINAIQLGDISVGITNKIDEKVSDAEMEIVTETEKIIDRTTKTIVTKTDEKIDRIEIRIAKAIADFERSIQNKIEAVDKRTLQILMKEKVGLITDIDETRIFEGFTGSYFAFNDPLQYELKPASRGNRLRVHIERYQNKNFTQASYYYPILKHPKTSIQNEWLLNIQEFWQTLLREGRLTEEEQLKLHFFVPDENYKYSSTSEITYFIGSKSTGRQAIIYFHNRVFMDMGLKIPTRMLVVYDEETIQELESHRLQETKNMQHICGINNFLEYL